MNLNGIINFNLATRCEMCKQEFALLFPKVLNHSDLTSKFCTAFGSPCNLKR